MEDLAAIVMVMFVAWIASGVALAALAWLAPVTWSRALRLTLLLVTAGIAVLLTVALFGIGLAAATAAIGAALVVLLGLRRS
jgi:hypothetical protein